MRFPGSRRHSFLPSSPKARSACATVILSLTVFGAFQFQNKRNAIAQIEQHPLLVSSDTTLGGPTVKTPTTGRPALSESPQNPVWKLPPAPSGTAKTKVVPRSDVKSIPSAANTTPAKAVTPTIASAAPVASKPKSLVGENLIRVGLSTEGGAIEIYAPKGLILRDKKQVRALRVAAGEKIQLISGPDFEAKVGDQTFSGPIFVQNGAKISQGWQHIQIDTLADSNTNDVAELAKVTTNGKNARWGRPYRGNLEVFSNLDAEKFKRKGSLAIVNVVPLEQYLKGVVPWEMSPSAPLEALKAQAICARTKTLQFVAAKKFKGFDICDYDACQGYPGTENEKDSTSRAVELTKGLALYFKNQIIDAVFSTNSGGITAAASDVWNSSSFIPYLASIKAFDKGSDLNSIVKKGMTEENWVQYFSQPWPSFSRPDQAARDALAARRRKSASTAALYGPEDWPEFYRWKRVIPAQDAGVAFSRQGIKSISSFDVLERTSSGRIRKLKISGFSLAALSAPTAPLDPLSEPVLQPLSPDKTLVLEGDSKIRSMFSGRLGSTTALPSSSFSIEPQIGADGQIQNWVLRGAGWGHGVGLCQRSAQNLAAKGWGATKILDYFYKDIDLRQIKS